MYIHNLFTLISKIQHSCTGAICQPHPQASTLFGCLCSTWKNAGKPGNEAGTMQPPTFTFPGNEAGTMQPPTFTFPGNEAGTMQPPTFTFPGNEAGTMQPPTFTFPGNEAGTMQPLTFTFPGNEADRMQPPTFTFISNSKKMHGLLRLQSYLYMEEVTAVL